MRGLSDTFLFQNGSAVSYAQLLDLVRDMEAEFTHARAIATITSTPKVMPVVLDQSLLALPVSANPEADRSLLTFMESTQSSLRDIKSNVGSLTSEMSELRRIQGNLVTDASKRLNLVLTGEASRETGPFRPAAPPAPADATSGSGPTYQQPPFRDNLPMGSTRTSTPTGTLSPPSDSQTGRHQSFPMPRAPTPTTPTGPFSPRGPFSPTAMNHEQAPGTPRPTTPIQSTGSPAPGASATSQPRYCYSFQRGECRRGNTCPYVHEIAPPGSVSRSRDIRPRRSPHIAGVCTSFLAGDCRAGNQCMFKHPDNLNPSMVLTLYELAFEVDDMCSGRMLEMDSISVEDEPTHGAGSF